MKRYRSDRATAGEAYRAFDQRSYQHRGASTATGAITLSDSNVVKDSGGVLLGKLSNFRVRHACDRTRIAHRRHLKGKIGMALRIEAQRREMDQAIPSNPVGDGFRSTTSNSAFGIAEKLSAGFASAPTASGKTYLVLQWLIDQMRSSEMRAPLFTWRRRERSFPRSKAPNGLLEPAD